MNVDELYNRDGHVRLAVCVCQFVPQECTHETNGLLYFDLLTSKMYRCTGHQWQEWGWGSTGGGFQYTALLRDSAAVDDQPPASSAADTEPAGTHASSQVNDVTTMSSRRQVNRQPAAGRGRRKSCRQGY